MGFVRVIVDAVDEVIRVSLSWRYDLCPHDDARDPSILWKCAHGVDSRYIRLLKLLHSIPGQGESAEIASEIHNWHSEPS